MNVRQSDKTSPQRVDSAVSDSQVMTTQKEPVSTKYDDEREAIIRDIAYLLRRIGNTDTRELRRVELQRIQARLAGIVRDYCSE